MVCSPLLASPLVFGQAAPVVGSDNPAALFTDKDPVLNRNKQAAMHIVIDLLEAGHWSEADKWLTERYIQHNPAFASGRETIMKAFGARGAGPPDSGVSERLADESGSSARRRRSGMRSDARELPDPRNPGQTYTTTHFDMWRFVDGKADEHWDEGRINPPPPPKQ